MYIMEVSITWFNARVDSSQEKEGVIVEQDRACSSGGGKSHDHEAPP